MVYELMFIITDFRKSSMPGCSCQCNVR